MKYARKSYLRERRRRRANQATTADLLDRQHVFAALSTGLAAGLTAAESIKTLQASSGNGNTRTIQSLTQALLAGNSVTESFRRHQLVSDFDLALLQIGERSGTLAAVTRKILRRYEQSLARSRKLRTAFAMPLFVGLLALFVLPLPEFIKGNLDPTHYTISVALMSLFAVACWQIARIGFATIASTATGYPAHLFIDLPLLGDFFLSYSRAHFLDRLSLLYLSGYPIIEAIERSQESLVGFARRRRYKQIIQELHDGYNLGDAFEHLNILSNEQLPIFISAEAAGRLDAGLRRVSDDATQTLDKKIDALVTWVPRLAYVVIAMGIASRIL